MTSRIQLVLLPERKGKGLICLIATMAHCWNVNGQWCAWRWERGEMTCGTLTTFSPFPPSKSPQHFHPPHSPHQYRICGRSYSSQCSVVWSGLSGGHPNWQCYSHASLVYKMLLMLGACSKAHMKALHYCNIDTFFLRSEHTIVSADLTHSQCFEKLALPFAVEVIPPNDVKVHNWVIVVGDSLGKDNAVLGESLAMV